MNLHVCVKWQIITLVFYKQLYTLTTHSQCSIM